ncbi:DEAD/DEAH box helicase [Bacillus rubiinfantis]|uniref:DEAD/DEAH box helicase n=1 Tax=Bacillus rubiinfantis TaxID=1499680 RepID=UPI0005AADB6B|nr:DEAD/DEAH box helicase [Bacillus rubiinfantis]
MIHSLTDSDVKDLFSSFNYRKGRAYYNQGRVKDLAYDPSREAWYAVVRGTKRYQVGVYESELGLEFDCNCPAFEMYDQECKHVVAVMLEIKERLDFEENVSYREKRLKEIQLQREREQAEYERQQQERQALYIKQLTDQLIATFANHQQQMLLQADIEVKQPLAVEWICKVKKTYQQPVLTLEMKVGPKRTYVVKNLHDFLRAIRQKNHYPFTKSFSYDPTEYTFAAKDQEIIDLLQETTKNEEMYRNLQSPYSYGSASDGRTVTIPPLLADQLVEKLAARLTKFENKGNVYGQFHHYKNKLPLSIRLDKGSKEAFQLDVSDFGFVEYLEMYGYVVKENELYQLTQEQQDFFKEINKFIQLAHTPVIPISHEQIEPLLSSVGPILNEVGRLEVADSIATKIMQYPLKAKVYVDSNDGLLHMKLEYQYGEHSINPFVAQPVETETDTILIRDTEKEQLIMNILESTPLKSAGQELYLEGEEEIFEFLYEILPKLEELAEIFLTKQVQSFILPERHSPVMHADVDSSGNWLEVSFGMDGIEQSDIEQVLRSAIEKKRYYRLHNGTFVPLESEEFQTIQNVLLDFNIKSSQLKQESFRLPLYRGMELDNLVGEDKSKVKFGKTLRQLLTRLRHPEELDFELPSSLQAELRDYQYYGYQWLRTLGFYGFGGILADDMGLGKTLQSIALLAADVEEQKEQKERKPALIVSPASLVYNWKNEITKFAPSLRTEVLIGSPEERLEKLQSDSLPDIWITSYPTLRQDSEIYQQHAFRTLILDEAQAIKNYATKTAKAVRDIAAETRFALSGTPIENSIDELWSIFQVIMPDFFPSQKVFRQLPAEKVARMIKPFLLRRVKKDVLKELPDKIETVQVSELTKEQKELYLAYLEKIKTETSDSLQGEGFQKSRMKILAGLTRLRQLCCHPALFLENYQGESGKLQQLMDVVVNALENGRRLLIFSQFTSMLHLIRDSLDRADLSHFYLDGQTAAKERVQLVDRFNNGEADIFLISLKAGNTGLNLTGADTVILYDLWWNPAVEEQAAGRAHRMGQKNVVQVIRFITQGTIEEKMYELQQRKKELIETVIEQGDQAASRMTEEDIREILNI